MHNLTQRFFQLNPQFETAEYLQGSSKFRIVSFNVTTGVSLFCDWEPTIGEAIKHVYDEHGYDAHEFKADKAKVQGKLHHRKVQCYSALYLEAESEYRAKVPVVPATIFIENLH